ncbi:MAG: adenylyltransferase/cytidyltransferase family protein [Armatimonadota bacterium]|nr:adenylyltransferase/cytidyltransferase family protein [Armatimonadota bacterium]MDW8105150.1 adenylyltransferase/cytidyltransferase family protein [Armatimonadota bacterium]
MGLIVEWEELLPLRQQWRAEGKTVVWTNGCFDLLHLGHVKGLQWAKAQGDILVVGLNSDQSVRQLKGAGRPVFPQGYRAEMLAALGAVDYVVIFDDLEPSRLVAELQPDVVCKGEDYADGKKPMPEAEVVRSYGGRVCFVPLYEDYSTTHLLQTIADLSSRAE